MRAQAAHSEIRRLAAPVINAIDWLWHRMHWWIIGMAIVYFLSGITIVKPDEIVLIFRWGRLVGDTPALQQHGPGLLIAFPKPIDRVLRVQVKHVWETQISSLASGDNWNTDYGLDPLTSGYALTGDQNIVHVDMIARYRVKEPAQWVLLGAKPKDLLRVQVTAAMVRTLGEIGVDTVLAEGRKNLIAAATRRAQVGLDAAHSGIELESLEVSRLGPPHALATEFDAVQSAFIEAETKKKEAEAFAQQVIPQAQADSGIQVQSAKADAAGDLSRANGEADAFVALATEYRANPKVVRERLYRDSVDLAIATAARVEWVPPPSGNRYQGLRISLAPLKAGPGKQSVPDKKTPTIDEGEEEEK